MVQTVPTAELDARFSSEGADEGKLRRIAAAYESKYGRQWHFDVRDHAFVHEDSREEHVALVFEVNPAKALGFRKGEPYSQTRWRFARV